MKKITIAILLNSLMVAPAIASDFYTVVKVGAVLYAYPTSQNASGVSGGYSNGTMTNDMQTGFGLLAGYEINRHFAAELELNDLGGFDINSRTVKGSAAAVSGVYFHEFNEKFSLGGKLGIARSGLKAKMKPGYISSFPLTAYNTNLKLGFYGQFNFNPAAGIRAGWDIYLVGNKDTTTSAALFSYVGGVFKF